LLAAGIGVAVLLIVLATLRSQPQPAEVESLRPEEAVALVAKEMRSPAAALQVSRDGQARFEDGSWFITVDDASFRFSQRKLIVVPENDAARALEFQAP
jgi:hypothetical protein